MYHILFIIIYIFILLELCISSYKSYFLYILNVLPLLAVLC